VTLLMRLEIRVPLQIAELDAAGLAPFLQLAPMSLEEFQVPAVHPDLCLDTIPFLPQRHGELHARPRFDHHVELVRARLAQTTGVKLHDVLGPFQRVKEQLQCRR